jgi:hypothetical protein
VELEFLEGVGEEGEEGEEGVVAMVEAKADEEEGEEWEEDLGLLGLELEVENLDHWLVEVIVSWNFECLVFGYTGLAVSKV